MTFLTGEKIILKEWRGETKELAKKEYHPVDVEKLPHPLVAASTAIDSLVLLSTETVLVYSCWIPLPGYKRGCICSLVRGASALLSIPKVNSYPARK
jgi:hypothetical protein